MIASATKAARGIHFQNVSAARMSLVLLQLLLLQLQLLLPLLLLLLLLELETSLMVVQE